VTSQPLTGDRGAEARSSHRVLPVFQGIATAGLIAAALVQYLPAVVLLMIHAERVSPLTWLSISIPGLLSLLALMQRPGTNRVWSLNFAGLVLLTVQATMPQPPGPTWFPFLYAAFALSFGAAFSLPTVPAIIMVCAAACLDALSVVRPLDHIILSTAELAGGAIGPLFILITGLGLVGVARSWRSVARSADERAEEIAHASDSSYRAFQVQSAKTLVERRIHETVLNTLRAIAQKGPHDEDVLRHQCLRDVERLDAGLGPLSGATLHDIVSECWAAAAPSDVEFEIRLPPNFTLPSQTAFVLRDALVEALRNVSRHSRATSVNLSAYIEDSTLHLLVADNGVGLGDEAVQRFGLRNAIRAAVVALGGDAAISNQTDGGAVVHISVPVASAVELKAPAEPVFAVLTQSIQGRMLLLAPVVAGIFMLPWLGTSLSNSWFWLGTSYVCFLLANLWLATTWKSPKIPVPAALAVLSGALVYIAAQRGITGCQSASAIHWVINSLGGGFSLLIFASFGRRWHPFIVPLVTVAGMWLAFSLPAGCRPSAFMPVFATTVYLVTAMWLLSVLWRVTDRQRAHAVEMWARATAERVDIERQQTAMVQWSRVSVSTRELLRGIADGSLNVNDPDVRDRARAEESALRANLATPDSEGSKIWSDLLTVVNKAAARGISVEAECIEFPTGDAHLPRRMLRVIDQIVSQSVTNSVTLRLFVDRDVAELVCVCKRAVTDLVLAEELEGGLQPLPWTFDEDDGVVVHVDSMEGDLAYISLRQPLMREPVSVTT
jgi:signal transduction histidine kinase